ncbi:ferritin family protein [Proteinivorax hydrogeniformans]|uniref:Ferritin family protein n=1 Tax=Proteinivorax hydrogeniformans TaxID=1826727 RepID=A0AAU8HRF7_9FIRM
MELDLVVENQLGATRGTALEEAVDANFAGENTEVGWYLAAARQAQREGYPEIAEVLKTIAMEEADHAARFGELNGEISTSTKDNLEFALTGEQKSNKMKKEAATKAKEIGNDPAHDVFDETAKDEGRHARALEGLLERYF